MPGHIRPSLDSFFFLRPMQQTSKLPISRWNKSAPSNKTFITLHFVFIHTSLNSFSFFSCYFLFFPPIILIGIHQEFHSSRFLDSNLSFLLYFSVLLRFFKKLSFLWGKWCVKRNFSLFRLFMMYFLFSFHHSS